MIIFLNGRIVIKYGTNALVKYEGGAFIGLNLERIRGIALIVNELYSAGIEPILVSSGAVAAGMDINNLTERPSDEEELRDLSAEGQVYLMSEYQKALAVYDIGAYQMLVSSLVFSTEKSRSTVRKRIESSFKKRKIAIFNSNDAISQRFVDNDPLAANIARYCNANSLIMVSEQGILGSGGGNSKGKALKHAEKSGIRTAVMTHDELEGLVKYISK